MQPSAVRLAPMRGAPMEPDRRECARVGAENPVTSVDLVLRAILSALARLLPGGHLRHLRLTVSPRTFCAGTATWRPGEQPG